ncbi:condensation domain-containing protein [Labedaea rhizosphaerae]|uniref:Phosphopantetheine binding protein n=1 Tax=Labedaea rhizosphaerae TaxID=598644 RepID=A0A4V3CY54_LABRH|nr:condensation domain-containing protein [Labedaea rhizosphaerae]TDP92848.1 phosphopantetheine binding protein [Labedaea rhizosphaerae]
MTLQQDSPVAVPSVSPAAGVPVTAMQESLWWVHQRARNQSVYNLTWRLGCGSTVDVTALGVAWQAVVDRHEALRTAVYRVDGELRLVVTPTLPVRVQRIQIADPGGTPTDELLRLVCEELSEQSFALDTAPLARLASIEVAGTQELLLTVHHVAVDGWGIQLIMQDLSVAYAAALTGAEPKFEGDAEPFTAYAAEQAAARAAGDWAASLEHWRSALDGAVSTTVCADHDRFAGTGAPGVTLRYRFSQEAAAAVGALGTSHYATPFAVLLAALQIVLARGGAGEDVAIGAVLANRMTPRDQALVGYLANLCIARATVRADDTIGDVVGRGRDAVWTMLAHQHVPYATVFGALTESTQSMLSDYAPLLLNYLGPIAAGLALGDVPLVLHRTPNRAARADISIAFWEVEGAYWTEIEYNTGRYERPTVMRLLHDLDAVLAAGGADATTRVADLSVRTRASAGHLDHHRPAAAAAPVRALPASATWELAGRLWQEVLGHQAGGPDEDFFAAGGRSLKVIQLAVAVEAATGQRLDVVAWLARPTPRTLVQQLEAEAEPADAMSTVVPLREGAGGPHLHLVHGASGSAQDYRHLAAALPDGWRVTASQERTPLPDVLSMARRYLADLLAEGDAPDILCGWSMGGQVCYRMAAALAESGAAPALAVLDAAPPVGYPMDADRERECFETFAAGIAAALGIPPGTALPVVHGDDGELAIRALAAHLAAASPTGETVPTATLLDRWRVHLRHTEAVAAFVGTDQVPGAGLVVGADLLDVQLDQWATLFKSPPARLRLGTGHHGVLTEDVAATLAGALTNLLPHH